MTLASGVLLRAFVSPAEAPIVKNAARRLEEWLTGAGAKVPAVGVEFVQSLGDLSRGDGPAVLIASMLPDLDEALGDWPNAEARLTGAYQGLAERGGALAFLCTVFRHVPQELGEEARDALRLAIRRLDLLAIGVSHTTGLNLIDLDRALAHIGALALETDYRLGGMAARKAAGRAVAATILGAGLDEWIAPEVQERAAAIGAA